MCCNYWSPTALEPVLNNKRNDCNKKPVHSNEGPAQSKREESFKTTKKKSPSAVLIYCKEVTDAVWDRTGQKPSVVIPERRKELSVLDTVRETLALFEDDFSYRQTSQLTQGGCPCDREFHVISGVEKSWEECSPCRRERASSSYRTGSWSGLPLISFPKLTFP